MLVAKTKTQYQPSEGIIIKCIKFNFRNAPWLMRGKFKLTAKYQLNLPLSANELLGT